MYEEGYVTDTEQAKAFYEEYNIPYRLVRRTNRYYGDQTGDLEDDRIIRAQRSPRKVITEMLATVDNLIEEVSPELVLRTTGRAVKISNTLLDHVDFWRTAKGEDIMVCSPYLPDTSYIALRIAPGMLEHGYEIKDTGYRIYRYEVALMIKKCR